METKAPAHPNPCLISAVFALYTPGSLTSRIVQGRGMSKLFKKVRSLTRHTIFFGLIRLAGHI